jgi:hypothetical protein
MTERNISFIHGTPLPRMRIGLLGEWGSFCSRVTVADTARGPVMRGFRAIRGPRVQMFGEFEPTLRERLPPGSPAPVGERGGLAQAMLSLCVISLR